MVYCYCQCHSCYARTREIHYLAAENIELIKTFLTDYKDDYLSKWEYIALEDYETNEMDYDDEFDSDADKAWEMFYDSFTYQDYAESYEYSLLPIEKNDFENLPWTVIEKGEIR